MSYIYFENSEQIEKAKETLLRFVQQNEDFYKKYPAIKIETSEVDEND